MRRGPPPGHSRVELWIPDHQLADFRDAARDAGVSLGAWLRCAALAALDNEDLDTDEEAVEADRAARPSQGITDGPKSHGPLPNGRGGFVARFPAGTSEDDALNAVLFAHADSVDRRQIVLRAVPAGGGWLAWSEVAA